MHNLTKHERVAVIVLISALILGLAMMARQKYRPARHITVERFGLESSADLIGLDLEDAEKININQAGTEDLMRLKGVGKVLAERIVTYRSQKGYFRSKDELKDVKGIGEKLFNDIKDRITTD